MEKISELIKEAKPLYKTRKRNRNILRASLCCCLPLLVLSAFAYNTYTINTLDLNSSPIEDMGFQTDEYGLLMVE